MKKKWYVVLKGKVPGVNDDWDDCLVQVNEFPNNSYKGYNTKEEAEARYKKHLSKKEECGRMKTKKEETMLKTERTLSLSTFLIYNDMTMFCVN
jgi:viroplasmin and RNaseH domain-containing protein